MISNLKTPMTEYVKIINHGQICEVMGRTHCGGVMLRNPNYGKNMLFNKKAVEPAPHGQYMYCWGCNSPILIDYPDPYVWAVCSEHCDQEKREHYT